MGENVALLIKEYGSVDPKIIQEIVRIKLSLVGLAESKTDAEELSAGMKKRAGLARALLLDPPLVFFG